LKGRVLTGNLPHRAGGISSRGERPVCKKKKSARGGKRKATSTGGGSRRKEGSRDPPGNLKKIFVLEEKVFRKRIERVGEIGRGVRGSEARRKRDVGIFRRVKPAASRVENGASGKRGGGIPGGQGTPASAISISDV